MRSWQFLLAIIAFATILIGLEMSQDRTKKGNVSMFEQNWTWKRCPTCGQLWCTDRLFCPTDNKTLISVGAFTSSIEKPALAVPSWHIDEFADVWRELETDARTPFTARQVLQCIEMQRSYNAASDERAHTEATKRLQFVRYLVETGRLSEDMQ